MKHSKFTIPFLFLSAAMGESGTGAPPLPVLQTPEELAALAANAAAKKEADKKAKAELAAHARAEKKVASEAAKAGKKAEAESAKLAKAEAAELAKAAKVQEAAAKAQAKIDAKAAREQAKIANRMPEQNGVRRPKPETLCGQAWGAFDALTANLGQAVSIAAALEVTTPAGLVEGNVKAEYARWRKFNGITGRVAKPAQEVAPALPGTQETM